MKKDELKQRILNAGLDDDLAQLLIGKIDAATDEEAELALQDAIHAAMAQVSQEAGIEIPTDDAEMAAAREEFEQEMQAATSEFQEAVDEAMAPAEEAMDQMSEAVQGLDRAMAREDVEEA